MKIFDERLLQNVGSDKMKAKQTYLVEKIVFFRSKQGRVRWPVPLWNDEPFFFSRTSVSVIFRWNRTQTCLDWGCQGSVL